MSEELKLKIAAQRQAAKIQPKVLKPLPVKEKKEVYKPERKVFRNEKAVKERIKDETKMRSALKLILSDDYKDFKTAYMIFAESPEGKELLKQGVPDLKQYWNESIPIDQKRVYIFQSLGKEKDAAWERPKFLKVLSSFSPELQNEFIQAYLDQAKGYTEFYELWGRTKENVARISEDQKEGDVSRGQAVDIRGMILEDLGQRAIQYSGQAAEKKQDAKVVNRLVKRKGQDYMTDKDVLVWAEKSIPSTPQPYQLAKFAAPADKNDPYIGYRAHIRERYSEDTLQGPVAEKFGISFEQGEEDFDQDLEKYLQKRGISDRKGDLYQKALGDFIDERTEQVFDLEFRSVHQELAKDYIEAAKLLGIPGEKLTPGELVSALTRAIEDTFLLYKSDEELSELSGLPSDTARIVMIAGAQAAQKKTRGKPVRETQLLTSELQQITGMSGKTPRADMIAAIQNSEISGILDTRRQRKQPVPAIPAEEDRSVPLVLDTEKLESKFPDLKNTLLRENTLKQLGVTSVQLTPGGIEKYIAKVTPRRAQLIEESRISKEDALTLPDEKLLVARDKDELIEKLLLYTKLSREELEKLSIEQLHQRFRTYESKLEGGIYLDDYEELLRQQPCIQDYKGLKWAGKNVTGIFIQPVGNNPNVIIASYTLPNEVLKVSELGNFYLPKASFFSLQCNRYSHKRIMDRDGNLICYDSRGQPQAFKVGFTVNSRMGYEISTPRPKYVEPEGKTALDIVENTRGVVNKFRAELDAKAESRLYEICRKSMDVQAINAFNILIAYSDRKEYDSVRVKWANFSGLELRGIHFQNCTFVYSNFQLALIEKCTFVNCTLDYSDFTGAVISDTKFTGCSLLNVEISEVSEEKVSYIQTRKTPREGFVLLSPDIFEAEKEFMRNKQKMEQNRVAHILTSSISGSVIEFAKAQLSNILSGVAPIKPYELESPYISKAISSAIHDGGYTTIGELFQAIAKLKIFLELPISDFFRQSLRNFGVGPEFLLTEDYAATASMGMVQGGYNPDMKLKIDEKSAYELGIYFVREISQVVSEMVDAYYQYINPTMRTPTRPRKPGRARFKSSYVCENQDALFLLPEDTLFYRDPESNAVYCIDKDQFAQQIESGDYTNAYTGKKFEKTFLDLYTVSYFDPESGKTYKLPYISLRERFSQGDFSLPDRSGDFTQDFVRSILENTLADRQKHVQLVNRALTECKNFEEVAHIPIDTLATIKDLDDTYCIPYEKMFEMFRQSRFVNPYTGKAISLREVENFNMIHNAAEKTETVFVVENGIPYTVPYNTLRGVKRFVNPHTGNEIPVNMIPLAIRESRVEEKGVLESVPDINGLWDLAVSKVREIETQYDMEALEDGIKEPEEDQPKGQLPEEEVEEESEDSEEEESEDSEEEESEDSEEEESEDSEEEESEDSEEEKEPKTGKVLEEDDDEEVKSVVVKTPIKPVKGGCTVCGEDVAFGSVVKLGEQYHKVFFCSTKCMEDYEFPQVNTGRRKK